jgi:NAD(P)-dependent dehydrogenase (short-subunit alcohol dehydrogenase family)
MMKETLDKFKDIIVDSTPLGRIGGPPDIGGACIYLGSKASSWITGVILTVDGGTVLGSSKI